MSVTTPDARRLGRTDKPFNPGRHRRADFARSVVFSEFGYHGARALDYESFVDRLPGELPTRVPEAGFAE